MHVKYYNTSLCKGINKIFIIVFLSFLLPKVQLAAENNHKPFNAGETIIEHVVDAYEWHILTYKDKHVSISLPVILIDNGEMKIFSSSHFHHGQQSYENYAIYPLSGAKKGKIVKIKDAEKPNNDNQADAVNDAEGELGATGESNEEEESVNDGDSKAKTPVFTVMTDDGTERNVMVDKEASLLDLSITKNVLALFISLALLLWMVLAAARNYKKRGHLAPKGIARLVELLVVFVKDDVAKPAIGERYKKYLPFLLTTFFFIFFNNLLGIIPFFPGGANLTGNIAVTLVLAICTFVITNVSGNKHYWIDIVNTPGVPWWLKIPLPLMPVVEIVGVFTKPIVLMIRLFANITAGHIVCLGFICIIFIFGATNPAIGYGASPISVLFYVFMSALECLVAYIQAYVFTLLSAIYIGLAVAEPAHEAHK